ncbi:MAG: alpha-L-rhamnosidase, partial [Ignavibacteria bacterium]|nr:alpha-L-rhamnosidase [Ignavibacteria bacterium]
MPKARHHPRRSAISRRGFFRSAALGGMGFALLAQPGEGRPQLRKPSGRSMVIPEIPHPSPRALDLSPAKWIWYPSERTLCNTVVLFRRVLRLPSKPKKATGWILADSRYRLFVNGARHQWGPAPSDPRWVEVDPLDLTPVLKKGENVIAVEVLYYGLGDGTWPIGKPGFLFSLDIEAEDGTAEKVVSDNAWLTFLARSWKPGQYKRWYLRALQEEFDARLFPYGWTEASYAPGADWLPAMPLDCPADKPVICASYPEYAMEIQGTRAISELRPRSVPFMKESTVPVKQLAESLWVTWRRTPLDYFDYVTPNCFDIDRSPSATQVGVGSWKVTLDGARAAALTFEFEEQIVGWPFFSIEAPEGTVVELMVQEAHRVGGPPLLNTQFHAWTRFTCREGVNHFETFDFESCRWLQLHIRGTKGDVVISEVGVRRRQFPWPDDAQIALSEPSLQRLMDASVNTLHNCAQENLVDGMARERQQYSGDCGHQVHGIYFAFGETGLPARYLATFGQGITLDGYFLDCWPAYDRLARLMERQLQLTPWGPLLDHGVGFNFDCWHHYLYTGDLEAIREPFPRLLRFFHYLRSIRGKDGLLPVENIGVPSVWIDHDAFLMQRHKQCSFNLYTAAMLPHALAPLCDAFGEKQWGREVRETSRSLLSATIKKFWDRRRNLFVDNLPWLREEERVRLSDRTLATAVLFEQSPGGITGPALEALAELPPEMGFSYPANAGWRLWALTKGGRTDVVLKDLRDRWATMESVRLNNTLQEAWVVHPDSTSQWSHCPIVPLYVLYMSIVGICPLVPGFRRYEVVPQLEDIERLDLGAHTVKGTLKFSSTGRK